MTILTNILFLISNALLMPVILVLVALFVHALVSLGGFYGLYLRRLKTQKQIDAHFDALLKKDGHHEGWGALMKSPTLFGHYLERLERAGWKGPHAEKVLTDCHDEIEGLLARHRFPMRLGPMLGLMATLIPLGPALTALGTGDISLMALHIQVAFAATVVGVLVGGLGYLVYTIKRRWFFRDLAHLEQLAQIRAAETHGALSAVAS